ncbi:10377_t:CDS:2 [Funneliformis caledonium]|uniref:10377_t:CDS:1 n=1 Tax=Funneliformis caledonium TaxID=1117310 RepID=A0A9N9CVP9_9GLOM|nr:10377_t:CDS:2 [Funneliformis caledonium]
MSNNNISMEEYNSLHKLLLNELKITTIKETVAAQSNTAISVAAITEALSLMTEKQQKLQRSYQQYQHEQHFILLQNVSLEVMFLEHMEQGNAQMYEKISNKLFKTIKNTGGFLNDIAGNEPLALPNMLWFGILDLAQNLIYTIEVMLHLKNINGVSFSMTEIDFNQYAQKLYEINSNNGSSERFQCLLSFVKEKCHQDLIMLNDDIGKGKRKMFRQNTYFKEQTLNSRKILDIITDEMTCPISLALEDQFYLLKCQHKISYNTYNKLRQKKCPICRERIEDNDVKFVL